MIIVEGLWTCCYFVVFFEGCTSFSCRSKDRERREKERDRKKKGLPLVRANFVTSK